MRSMAQLEHESQGTGTNPPKPVRAGQKMRGRREKPSPDGTERRSQRTQSELQLHGEWSYTMGARPSEKTAQHSQFSRRE